MHRTNDSEYYADLERVLHRIRFWRKESWAFRILNIALFLLAKILVPLFAALVSANLAWSSVGSPFLSGSTMIFMTVSVMVISALDTLLRPGQKKQVAFDRINELADIEDRLLVNYQSATTPEGRAVAITNALDRVNSVLKKAGETGW